MTHEVTELIQDITTTNSEIVHVDAQTNNIEHSEADISKAREDLEYEPTVSLREGLVQTIEWYRKQID